MLRTTLFFVLGTTALNAAENLAVPAAAPSLTLTLADLEAQPATAASDPGYWPSVLERTAQALQLIESNTLASGDEFFRVSKFITAADNRFRADRVRYEVLLAAAALGQAEAQKGLASAWDSLLAGLGRSVRTDFRELAQKHPEQFHLEPAPECVQAVLRDPEKARALAKSAERNAEVKTIVDADQADRRIDWSKLTPDESKALNERDVARNRRAREIIQAGDLHTAADFANASLVMQHSARFSGYQTAHELAVCSMLLGDRGTGRWLVAATYDRMLRSAGHDQRFGTQYSGMGSNGASTLGTVDTRGICDAERKALGCPTLEQAKNRTVGPVREKEAAKENSKLLAEFSGPDRTARDPKLGLVATYPEGWKIRDVLRWGDQQNTIFFELIGDPEPTPSLYYRVYRQPRTRTPEAVAEYMRAEMKKKEASRREYLSDYTNRADSFKTFTIGPDAAFSWLADFTASDGEKWAEYFVCIQTDQADASFFVQAPARRLDALRPAVDQLMAGLKMPTPQS